MNGKKAKRLRARLDYADELKGDAKLEKVVGGRLMKLVTGRVIQVPITAAMMYPHDAVRKVYRDAKKKGGLIC